MKKKLLLSILSLLIFATPALAEKIEDTNDKLKAFQSLKEINNLNLKVPTVVEVSLNNEFIERHDFAVLETNTEKFQGYYYKSEDTSTPVIIETSKNIQSGASKSLNDNDRKTYLEFSLPEKEMGKAEIKINSTRSLTSSSFILQLDRYVATPKYIEIKAEENGKIKTVLAKTRMYGQVVKFPKTNSRSWTINLEYNQPLRITELKLYQENLEKNAEKSLRFLARPGMSYKIYLNPDRYPEINAMEAGNLANDKDVKKLGYTQTKNNPLYQKADSDKDGVLDEIDNCVAVKNPDQIDIDENDRGDACDDHDRDGIINAHDNCPNHPNRRQLDNDGDNIGDECDGEESRLTEQNPWLPWLGMGIVALVIGGMLVSTMRKKTTN